MEEVVEQSLLECFFENADFFNQKDALTIFHQVKGNIKFVFNVRINLCLCSQLFET